MHLWRKTDDLAGSSGPSQFLWPDENGLWRAVVSYRAVPNRCRPDSTEESHFNSAADCGRTFLKDRSGIWYALWDWHQRIARWIEGPRCESSSDWRGGQKWVADGFWGIKRPKDLNNRGEPISLVQNMSGGHGNYWRNNALHLWACVSHKVRATVSSKWNIWESLPFSLSGYWVPKDFILVRH